MATTSYEDVLRDARQLTPVEQQRLRAELADLGHQSIVEAPPSELERQQAHEEHVRDALDKLDRLAARISAAWKDDMSAVDAVREQRREL